MSIVIKEIILSDTLEKFMEKVNFNFDQLMLAGGGPPGPIGPQGLAGPAGPKGDPGNKWYVGCTGTSSEIGVTLYNGDLFLQNECGASGASYGDVYEYNSLTEIFDSTGLNLIGPQGDPGVPGANLFGSIFTGLTTSVWIADSEGVPGPTSNYYLLKGDTTYIGNEYGSGPNDIVAGITSGYSRETLWLGGIKTAQERTSVWDLSEQPKLFVAARKTWPSSYYSGGSAHIAGGGISLGRDPQDLNITTAKSANWSNIFIDDLFNLRITNFTNFNDATVLNANPSGISLESAGAIRLLAQSFGPIPSISSNYSIDMGPNYIGTTITYGLDYGQLDQTPTLFDSGGLIITVDSSNSYSVLNSGDTGLINLHGGGAKRFNSSQPGSLYLPSLLLTNSTGVSDTQEGLYRIIIDPTSQSGDDTNFTQVRKLSTIIEKGFRLNATTGENQTYLGIGAGSEFNDATFPLPVANSRTHFHVVTELETNPFVMYDQTTGHGIQVGTKAQIDADWHNSYEYGADIVGRIRMQGSASSISQVITSVDADGTMQWTDSTAVGQWIEDSLCSSRIVLANDKFASTLNKDNESYSRFDIAISQGNTGVEPQADLTFINYANNIFPSNTPADLDLATYSITLDHLDASSAGQLSVNVYSNQQPCQPSLSGSSGTDRFKIQTWDSSGRIRIGGDADGLGTQTGLGEFDRIYVRSSNTTSINGNVSRVRSNIFLVNEGGDDNNESPLIKFSTFGQISGSSNSAIDETNFEVLRIADTVFGQRGPHNIRFKGTGYSPDQTYNPTGNFETTPAGSSGGAHVMMISDKENAIARNGKLENTNDYYELDHSEMHIDVCRIAYTSTNANNFFSGTPDNTQQTYTCSHQINLDKWGTAASGWNTYGNAQVFHGSRSGSVFSSRNKPNRLAIGEDRSNLALDNTKERTLSIRNLLPDSNPDNSLLTPGNEHVKYLNVWNSPTSSFRYTPMNFDAPAGASQTGIAMVNFNIDIGLIFESDETVKTQDESTGNYWAMIGGPGTLSHQNLKGPVKTQNAEFISMLDQVKIQSVRVKLQGGGIEGLGPMLTEQLVENISRVKDPLNPNRSLENTISNKKDNPRNFSTDWLPGTCKSMYSELKSNNSSLTFDVERNHPEGNGLLFQERLDDGSWTVYAGQRFDLATAFDAKATRLFDSGVATGGLPLPGGFNSNMGSSSNGIGFIFDITSDFAPKWQNASIMWRLEQDYETDQEPSVGSFVYTPPNPIVYLHIMYMRNPASEGSQTDRPYPFSFSTTSTNHWELNQNLPNTVYGGGGVSGAVANGPFGSGVPSSVANTSSGNRSESFSSIPNSKVWQQQNYSSWDGTYNNTENLAVQSYSNSIANSFGIPVNYLVVPESWYDDDGSGRNQKKMDSEFLFMNIKRREAFYQTHGLGFSGSGLVRWNNGGKYKINSNFAGA